MVFQGDICINTMMYRVWISYSTVTVTAASINVISLLLSILFSANLNLDRVNATVGHIIHVSRNRHVGYKRTLLEQTDIVLDALLQIVKREERQVVDIFAEVLANLGPEACIGKGEHTTIRLFHSLLALFEVVGYNACCGQNEGIRGE